MYVKNGVKNVIIGEASDGFEISVIYEDGASDTYSFNQEDTKEELVSVFRTLGFNSEYEEVC
jgi:hypothetical protein